MSDARTTAERWLETDPNPETRAATRALLDAVDDTGLQDAFGSTLAFGTAGLRGPLGPGPNRMNRANVIRVTAGLAEWVHRAASGTGPVVVGFDGRHGSEIFAADAARVLAGAGLPVVLFDSVCPTPLLAWAVKHLGGRAGVMVTASHNPPADNGYKVFWSDGAQIVPPHDVGIAAAAARVTDLSEVLRPALDDCRGRELVTAVPPEVRAAYVAAVHSLRVHREPTPLTVVYTAMHGVGWSLVHEVLGAVPTLTVVPVEAQRDPDGDFPTVDFPNPEEPGALDLAMAEAEAVGADLVVANDPDADRLAVAVPEAGGWRRLSGNEIGVLLADDLLTYGGVGSRMVATTLVSSSLLRTLAHHHRITYAETLTGFKWIARAAMDFEGTLVLGYEEALGYSIGGVVHDKDGVSAALVFCDLVAHLKRTGSSVAARLDALACEHGMHHTDQRSVVLAGVEGRDRIEAAMNALRTQAPAELAGRAVLTRRDLLSKVQLGADGTLTPSELPASDVLGFELAGGHRVHVRPSGTEPKLKLYVETVVPVVDDDLDGARDDARSLANRLLDAVAHIAGL